MRKVEPGRLRLRLLGRFGVEGDLDGPAPTGKAERLLKVLAANHGQLVPVETLVDALWLDHPPDRADRNVAVLVRLAAATPPGLSVTSMCTDPSRKC